MSIETTASTPDNTVSKTPNKLLKNRNFILLATGQAISNIGDFVFSTTLLVWVFSLTHSATAVSGVLVAQYAPVFLLGPIAGVFVDRWNRRSTMVVTDLLRMACALLPFVVPEPLRLPAIYASVFAISAFSRFFMPARMGVMQVIVAPEQQTRAASIGQATFALSIIVGPAIASPLYFLVGPFVACSINAASYLVSALCLVALRASRKALRPYTKSEKSGIGAIVSEVYAGMRLIVKSRVLYMVMILALIAMLGAGAMNALDIIFVTQRLHVSAGLYGPLTAVSGLGTLIGAILIGIFANSFKPSRLLSGCVLLLGIGITIYAFQTWYALALVIIFLSCLPQGGIDIAFAPLLLNATPRAMMGRVEAVLETGISGISLLSVALAGFFGQFVPVYLIFAVCGALVALAGVFGFVALPRNVVPIEEQIETSKESENVYG
jgi:predicted MFS family arabinose efflux permease